MYSKIGGNSHALKRFLLKLAKEDEKYNPLDEDKYWSSPVVRYYEDVNPDAEDVNNDIWLRLELLISGKSVVFLS